MNAPALSTSSFTANRSGGSFTPNRGGGSQQFADVVGQFQKQIVLNGGEPHARFDMGVNGDDWEADVNTESLRGADGGQGTSDVQYAIKDQVVSSLPSEGVHTGDSFSYSNQGLSESDFQTISSSQLQQQLEQMAKQSSRVELMGMTYHDPGKNGIHDIHMNSGESGGGNHPGQDGVARFYIQQDGQIHQETVYLKFQSQSLPGGSERGVA
jgi:hypothetical protein